MVEAARFLESVGDYLAFDGADDRSRTEILERARTFLETLRLAEPSSDFFIGATEVKWGSRPVPVSAATWLDRLRDEGVAILAPPNDPDGFARWIVRLAGQVAQGQSTPGSPGDEIEAAVDVEVEAILDVSAEAVQAAVLGRAQTLQPEVDMVWELHEQAFQGRPLVRSTASATVANLTAALDQTGLTAQAQIICPLDEYTTVHAVNTSLMAMKLATHLAYDEDEVFAVGLAGLLHDIGKARLGNLPSVSRQMLSPDEQDVLKAHPGEGAKLLLDAGPGFEMAAVVAYEHHMCWQVEGGYPLRHYERSPHAFSRLVSVCDVYDVLREPRTFRSALSGEAAIKYMRLQAGKTLDPAMVTAFADLALDPLPRVDPPTSEPLAEAHEIGWLPETGYDADCEPRPVRL